MSDIYFHPTKGTNKTIKDLQTKLKLKFAQKWHQEVSSIKLDRSTNEDSNKLRTYKILKKNFKQEKKIILEQL